MDIAVVAGAGVFVGLGLWLFTLGARNLWRAIASEHWPRVTAVASDSPSEPVEFHYDVGGVAYITTDRHFGQTGSSDAAEAQLISYRYPAGRIVTVAHHPNDPWIATAEPGFTSDLLWLPGAGLAFAVPGVMFIIMWFASSRGSERGFAIGMAMFASIFTTIGLIFLTNGLLNLWRTYQATHWPKAQGVVVCGRLDQSTHGTKPPPGDTDFTELSGNHFIYRFEVDGRRYYSNIRRFGQVDDSSMQHNDLYPLGGPITVSYAPGNPAISAVETGIANENYWIPGAGAAFFFFGLAVMIFGIPALTRSS